MEEEALKQKKETEVADVKKTEQEARLLVQQTAIGSAEMVKQNPDLDLMTLRNNVTKEGINKFLILVLHDFGNPAKELFESWIYSAQIKKEETDDA